MGGTMTNFRYAPGQWALILGGSSGFGLATAKKLSAHGMNICVVHRDRRGSMGRIDQEFSSIMANGVEFIALNTNALTPEGQEEVLSSLATHLEKTDGKIRLLLHSIAFGNLKLIAPTKRESSAKLSIACLAQELNIPVTQLEGAVNTLAAQGHLGLHTLQHVEYGEALLEEEDLAQTIYSMGTSLLTWVRGVFGRQLFAPDARVVGLTSEGNTVAWRGYAAVAAAKVAMESVSRAIAVEYAPYGIRSNIVQAGVTPTPALKLIPGSEQMEAVAKMRNPFRRTTTPEDVANVIALLCTDEAAWINGALLRVDGGEHIASL